MKLYFSGCIACFADYCATWIHVSKKDFCLLAAISSQAVEGENEKPEAGNKRDGALKRENMKGGINFAHGLSQSRTY